MNRESGEQRARCPDFQARTDYKGRRYIQCGGRAMRFPEKAVRDTWYKYCCCGNYKDCKIFKGGQSHGSTENH